MVPLRQVSTLTCVSPRTAGTVILTAPPRRSLDTSKESSHSTDHRQCFGLVAGRHRDLVAADGSGRSGREPPPAKLWISQPAQDGFGPGPRCVCRQTSAKRAESISNKDLHLTTSHTTETSEYRRVTTTRIRPIWNATPHPSPLPGSGPPVSRVSEGPQCHQNLCLSRRFCPKCPGDVQCVRLCP